MPRLAIAGVASLVMSRPSKPTDPAEARVLFRQLLAWGLSMSLVGALLCQLLAGLLARL